MQGTLPAEYSRLGVMARPAGANAIMAPKADEYYGKCLGKGHDREMHALRTASMYAERAQPGWGPKEPRVKPTWADRGAGSVSAGCIDNTYMVAPLSNRWGQQREKFQNEVTVLPHKQARLSPALARHLSYTLGKRLSWRSLFTVQPHRTPVPGDRAAG